MHGLSSRRDFLRLHDCVMTVTRRELLRIGCSQVQQEVDAESAESDGDTDGETTSGGSKKEESGGDGDEEPPILRQLTLPPSDDWLLLFLAAIFLILILYSLPHSAVAWLQSLASHFSLPGALGGWVRCLRTSRARSTVRLIMRSIIIGSLMGRFVPNFLSGLPDESFAFLVGLLGAPAIDIVAKKIRSLLEHGL